MREKPGAPRPEIFIVHDVSTFPIVRQRIDAIRPGYAAQWTLEMDNLVRGGTSFVVILDGRQPEEGHADRKSRGLWLKRNKPVMATVCKSVIVVEPRAGKRTALKVQAALAGKAFGTAMDVVASEGEALDLARSALLGAGLA